MLKRCLLLLLLLAGVLAACNSPAAPTLQSPTPEFAPTQAVTLAPSPTPTPQPGVVVFLSPPESDSALVDSFAAVLGELSAASGLELKTVPALQPAEMDARVQMVVCPGLPNNLPDLLAAAPLVQFVVVSPVEVGAAPNLSVIRFRPENTAFIAGYTAEVLASDWRAAGLLSAQEPYGSQEEDAFRRGAGYFCGICNPVNGPVVRFPLTARLTPSADPVAWQLPVEELRKNVLYVAYVSPGASSPELLSYLAQQGLTLLGGQTPPDGVRTRWAATITSDAAATLRQHWQELLAGNGGVWNASITLQDVQPELFSPARQEHVQKVIQDLEDGAISPLGVAP